LLKRLDLSTLKGVVGVLHLSEAVTTALHVTDFPWQDHKLPASQGTLRILTPAELPIYEKTLKTEHMDGIIAVLAPKGWVDALSALLPPHRPAARIPAGPVVPHLVWVLLFHDVFAHYRFWRPLTV
jgi:hypothetical protein